MTSSYLGGDERQVGHSHGVDETAVDDEPNLDRVARERHDVGEGTNCNVTIMTS